MRARPLPSAPLLHGSVGCGPPGSPVHAVLQQESWSGWPCPPPGDLPDLGVEPMSLTSSALADGLSSTGATWDAR